MKLASNSITFKRALVFSFVLHLILSGSMYLDAIVFKTKPPEPTISVDLVETLPPLQAVPITEEAKGKQIVDQDVHSINEEKPNKDAFLSAKDQTVLKQTVAKERGEFRNAKDKKSVDANKNAGSKTQRVFAKNKPKPSVHDLLGTSPTAQLQRQEEQSQSGDGSLGPSGSEASRTADYLKDLEAGHETILNTREFKYYTYYSRIRKQLSQYWEPSVKEKLNRLFTQGRRIASDQDHITKLLIVLNSNGGLLRVQVLGESGVEDLDQAATEAFRAAAPFPNPPKGIVEDDGTVKIRWDFVLES
jgi:TonB family protein